VTADETGFRIFVTENKCLVEPASKQTRQEDFLATWSNFSKYEQPNHHQTASLNGRRHEAPRLPQQMGISYAITAQYAVLSIDLLRHNRACAQSLMES